MNIVLFEPGELDRPLPRSDRRAQHVIRVLRRTVGDSFDAGLVNGQRGRATITEINPDLLKFVFDGYGTPPPATPISLIVGLPRPQTARDILRDATTMGVGRIDFVETERAEASYAQSTLWSSGEWQRLLVTGAEQAFDTRVPDVTHGRTLADTLTGTPAGANVVRIGLDNYEAVSALSELPVDRQSHIVVAVGPERGWSAAERDGLRAAGFTFTHLGTRVLRTETAVIAALTLVRAKLGLL